MNRQDANRQILEKISKIVEENPNLRFGQILLLLDINKAIVTKDGEAYYSDEFNTEPIILLERINNSIAEKSNAKK